MGSAECKLRRTIVEPFAKPVALKAAADELHASINEFREECGRGHYEYSAAQRDAQNFMETLNQQVHEYVQEASAT